jgi:HlyD family secretion protein
MSRALSWVKLHKTLSIVLLLVVVSTGYGLRPKAPVSPYETVKVERANIVQEVSVTGKVESEESVDLAFEKGGKITAVGAVVGDKVSQGDMLLRIDGSDVSASLAQAQANIAFEEATLEKLVKGARAEDIQLSQVSLENAEASLLDAENALRESMTDAYTKADDAIRNKTDIFFSNPRVDPQLTIPSTDFKLSLEVTNMRKVIETDLVAWGQHSTITEAGLLTEDVANTKKYLNDIKQFLERIALIVNAIAPSSATTQTTIDGWKASVSSARTSVGVAITSLSASEEKWRGAKSSVALATQQLALKKAGATAEEIAAQKARVASARASALTYRSQLDKLTLSAPFSGVVTKQDGKAGAIASPGTPMVSIQSAGAYKIEANVPEVDIAKLSENDAAKITLDAYGDQQPFTGVISRIDPAGKDIDGVPTYRITLRFEDNEGIVRSGMTANVRISSDTRENVLVIPARAIKESKTTEGERVVRVLLTPFGTPEERTVKVGLRGSDGKAEIIDGLLEGEEVVTFEKTVP